MITITYNGKEIGTETIGTEFNTIICNDGRMYKKSKLTELCYNSKTPDKLCRKLDYLFIKRTRIILNYGNVDTGESWGEIHDITGTIGRSTGVIKIPLLIYNSASYGGGAINDSNIIEIKESAGKKVMYSVLPPPPKEVNIVC